MGIFMTPLNIFDRCPYGDSLLIPGHNAVNPCVFESIILWLSLILFVFGSVQLIGLWTSPVLTKCSLKKLEKWGVWRLGSIAVQGVLLLTARARCLFVNGVAVMLVALPLGFLEYFKSPVTCGAPLFYFLFQLIILSLSILQSLVSGDYPVLDNDIRIYIVALNTLNILVCATAFYKPVHEVVKHYMKPGSIHANALSRLTFVWMNEVISKGYKNHKLRDEDIPDPPAALEPRTGYKQFQDVWDSQGKKSLLNALIKVFGLTLVSAIFIQLCNDILSFVSPQLLRLLIKFFDSKGEQQLIVGFLIALGLFVVSVAEISLHNQFFIILYKVGLGVRSALMSMVYHKALTLSPESKKERSTGDIVNILAVDVQRIQDLGNQFNMLVSAPIKIVLCLLSLYNLLGKATFTGMCTMAILIPVNGLLSASVRSLFMTQMKYKDKRTRTTSELLTSIKSIKLYAIEKTMLQRLAHVRNDLELANLKKISVYMGAVTFCWNCVPFMVSCSTFAAFALWYEQPLTPDIVFPALALFDLLAEPIGIIPMIITALVETAVSFKRITTFLLCEEIDSDLLKHFDRVDEESGVAVKAKNCTFLWESVKEKKEENYDEETTVGNSKVALVLDNFEAKKGQLTCIVGKVGAGKSTLLNSILGYLPCMGTDGTDPTLNIHGTVAYSSQIPWIMNTTVRENILFGHRYDEEFYQKTLESCQLLPDLQYYITSSRDLKRIVSVSRSPIFSHLQETLNGFETILAFGQSDRFQFIQFENLAFHLKVVYMFRSINRWLFSRLQFMGSIVIFSTASLAILQGISGGMAGLLITYALSVTSSLSFIVRMTVEVETNIVSVERVLDYCDLPPEADEITNVRPPEHWPTEGAVRFDHYTTKYRANLDPVLNNISFEVKPREKIGIVGRTGAGKSTLSLALFRIIEPTEGRVLIDDVDITKLGLHDLRSNLAIIPQDSQAFEGTVRQNLDPLGSYKDEQLWKALELAHLKPFIENLDKDDTDGNVGLDAKLSEGGSNMSVGQRQLLCLARALLNPSKVLVLDEATASVDVETDRVVQDTIRSEFKDRTILTIAHRIDTVMDSDKILVLESGEVKEFDSPQNLLKNKDSMFYHLCEQGGYIGTSSSTSTSEATN
ncbi:uncharacterized protein CYBJADRAFT_161059 [Cyberlindnera jadinii NRRL Y-1542]|uniref:P-loop containing nucleoside triphosphate hydrolase protein n=1 Tax=Cyberlindnera jadinii (strain ATCC 18201 / CBS 1600 / BCRC 20928 / JCM 3617 / NBRC 0987 / NRRL Y-1542) TaxID=983966 RepID=A0A1E4S852_CYBJN|nr:hypothetical protein CYBJADRAFT_161059 [Cyberlindnera jadinii NRRL Y-1542]ODV75658.1 hypothetical protein CYBJADRAFT_161059 [Cyberlindnera jadinii NRRL Y-1542]